MKSIFIILIVLGWSEGYSQSEYEKRLDSRVEQIKKEEGFNNSVIVLADTVDCGGCFPFWKPTVVYYLNDIVRLEHSFYESQIDSIIGIKPDTSPDSWRLVWGPHPYLFLRDTAKIRDLESLMRSEHPFVRVYAFAALSFRKHRNLVPVIFENLSDTRQFEQMTGDVGSIVYPAEMMIQYQREYLTKGDKQKLSSAIKTQHKHLVKCLELLE